MARSLNKVQLIGNLTSDPELRYTPQGTAVCSFTVATNRRWKDSAGQTKTEAMFHRIIAWSKLAEIVTQYVQKGTKIYLEGRLSNRDWQDRQGIAHSATEVVVEEVILLENKRVGRTPISPTAPTRINNTQPLTIPTDEQPMTAEDFIGNPEEPTPPEPEIEAVDTTVPTGKAEDLDINEIPL